MADGKSKSDILSAVVVDDLAAPEDEPTLCGDAHVTVWRRAKNAPRPTRALLIIPFGSASPGATGCLASHVSSLVFPSPTDSSMHIGHI